MNDQISHEEWEKYWTWFREAFLGASGKSMGPKNLDWYQEFTLQMDIASSHDHPRFDTLQAKLFEWLSA